MNEEYSRVSWRNCRHGKSNMFFNAHVFSNARELRKNPTKTDEELWSRLRNNQLGVRFRRQHPVVKYVVDFYCHSHRLAVEVDGTIHNMN